MHRIIVDEYDVFCLQSVSEDIQVFHVRLVNIQRAASRMKGGNFAPPVVDANACKEATNDFASVFVGTRRPKSNPQPAGLFKDKL